MHMFDFYLCPINDGFKPSYCVCFIGHTIGPCTRQIPKAMLTENSSFQTYYISSVCTVKVHVTMYGAFALNFSTIYFSPPVVPFFTQMLVDAFTTSPACDKVLKRRGHMGDFGMRVRVIYRDTSTRKNEIFFHVITKAAKYKDVSAGLTTNMRTRLFCKAIQSYCTVLLASACSIIDHSGCVLLHGVSNSVLVGQRKS